MHLESGLQIIADVEVKLMTSDHHPLWIGGYEAQQQHATSTCNASHAP